MERKVETKTASLERALGMSIDLCFGKIIPEEERKQHALLQDKIFEVCEKISSFKRLSQKDLEFVAKTRNAVFKVSSAQNRGENDPLIADRRFRDMVQKEFVPLLAVVDAERKERESESDEEPCFD